MVFKYGIRYNLIEKVVVVLVGRLVKFVFSEFDDFSSEFFKWIMLGINESLDFGVLDGCVGEVGRSIVVSQWFVFRVEGYINVFKEFILVL